MKTYNQIIRLASFLFVALLALPMRAVQYNGTEKLYFIASPSCATWWGDDDSGTSKYVYFFNETGANAWVEGIRNAEYYELTVPQGNWTYIILTRNPKSQPGWENVYGSSDSDKNQTTNIQLYEDRIRLTNFAKKGDCSDSYWWNQSWEDEVEAYFNHTIRPLSPEQVAEKDGIQVERWDMCTSMIGDRIVLKPTTPEGLPEPDYNQYEKFAWVKYTNANGWQIVTSVVAEDKQFDRETVVACTETNPVYYYLFELSKGGASRMVRITTERICEPTCDITRLEPVVGAVNVNNSTFAIDGIVSFEKAEGKLVITCEDKQVVYDTPVSPQTFSIEGLTADGEEHTLTASFEGDATCTRSVTIKAPNPSDGVKFYTYKNAVNKDPFTTDAVTLSPKNTPANAHRWVFNKAKSTYDPTVWDPETELSWNADGELEVENLVLPAPMFKEDTRLVFNYTEDNPDPGVWTDLLTNGNFDDDSFNYGNVGQTSPISEYIYWGKDVTNYYEHSYQGTSGGFAITKNAFDFWKYLAPVSPHSAPYYAYIDGEAGEDGETKAWHASTKVAGTEVNPNLRLDVGTTYLFSFWVANPNTMGEMDNAAILQFEITYNGKRELLGEPIDLNDYKDNLWHQNSALFTYPDNVPCTDVTIAVVDQNTSIRTSGNDFLLDDIQFHPISVLTKSIKASEEYTVNYLKSDITAITFTPTITNCGADNYTVAYDINLVHPNGKLMIADAETNEVIKEIELADDATNAKGTFTLPVSANNGEAPEHTLNVYFENYPLDGQLVTDGDFVYTVSNAKFAEPKVPVLNALNVNDLMQQLPACNDKTHFKLQVRTSYLYQRGEITITDRSENGTITNITANAITDANGEITGTTVSEYTTIAADGLKHTLTVRFNDTDCEQTVEYTAPKPLPDVVSNTFTSATVDADCASPDYTYKGTVTFANPRGTFYLEDLQTGTVYQWAEGEYQNPFNVEIPGLLADNESHAMLPYFGNGDRDCEAQKNSPSVIAFYTSPKAPVISAEPQYAVSEPDQTGHYALTFTVEYENVQNGYEINILNDKTNAVVATYVVDNESEGKGTANITIENLLADGQETDYTVYFLERPACAKHLTVKAPDGQQITGMTVVIDPVNCGETTFNLHVTVSYLYANASQLNIFEKNGLIVSQSAIVSGNGSYTFDLLNQPIPTADFTFRTFFIGKENDYLDDQDTHHVVAKSDVKFANVTYTPSDDCTDTNYKISGQLNFANAQGLIDLYYDGDIVLQLDPTGVTSPADFTFSKPADGQAHTLTAKFADNHDTDCADEYAITKTPSGQVITSVTVVRTDANDCGKTTYDAQISVAYENSKGTLYVQYQGRTAPVPMDAPIINPQVINFTDLPVTGEPQVAKAWYGGRENCEVTSEPLLVKPLPVIYSVSVLQESLKPDCNGTTYTPQGQIECKYAEGHLVLVDENDNVLWETDVTYSANTQLIDYQSKALLADGDGTKQHSLRAYFTQAPDCGMENSYIAPAGQTLSNLTASASEIVCGDLTYSLTLTCDISNCSAGDLVRFESGQILVQVVSLTQEQVDAGQVTYTFDNLPVQPSEQQFTATARFETRIDCQPLEANYFAPMERTMQVVVDEYDAVTCGQDATPLNFRVYQKGQVGKLTITDLTDNNKVVYGPADAQAELKDATLPLALGKQHNLLFQFDGNGDCKLTRLVTLPNRLELSNLEAVVHPIDNNTTANTFLVDVIPTFSTNNDDETLTIKEGATVLSFLSDPVSGSSYQVELPADGQPHTLTALMASGCEMDITVPAQQQPALNNLNVAVQQAVLPCGTTAYDATVTLSVTNLYGDFVLIDKATEEQVAQGTVNKTDTELSFDIALQTTEIGAKHTYLFILNGTDQIESNETTEPVAEQEIVATVAPIELQCAVAGDVVTLKATVTQGNPYKYTVLFGSKLFADLEGEMPQDGNIAITLPEGITGGVYTAELHLLSEFELCETVLPFRFELTHDNLVYSKWTDVLFIDNHNDLFVSYQWYENGTALQGETQQRLYRPDSALDGQYYCVITTTDGQQIRTCTYAFSDAPRSADEAAKRYHKVTPTMMPKNNIVMVERSEQTKARIELYDATGRLLQTVQTQASITTLSAPSVSGVYFIRLTDLETNEHWTEKIVVK